MKAMLQKCIQEDPKRWDQILTLLMFAIRKAPQASTRCSPLELVDGYQPRGLLNMVREDWERQRALGAQVSGHLTELWQWLIKHRKIVEENLQRAQTKQESYYDCKA